MQVTIFMKKVWVMIMNKKITFQLMLQKYFTDYLVNQRGFSDNTIDNYRITFIQFIMYFKTVLNIEPDKIRMEDISVELVNNFLNWLEEARNVCASTRNNRLAGIKSFFKYVSYHYPDYLNQCTLIRSIERKSEEVKTPKYLTIEATKHFFSTFDTQNKKDLRNLCIIMLLYESGARVSELTHIKTYELNLTAPHKLVLHGKGNKARPIPIDSAVISYIKRYIELYNIGENDYLFMNSRKEKLTRKGIEYILKKCFKKAQSMRPSLYPDSISPHSLRHSKGMHLLENGVNQIYIRDYLGHVSISTTEIYAKANPEVMRKHIEEASKGLVEKTDYDQKEKDQLLKWLEGFKGNI